MKLSEKYNQVTLITSILILILTGVIYYSVIHYILTEKLDRDLNIEENEIFEYVRNYKVLPLPSNFDEQIVSYTEMQAGTFHRYYKDTVYHAKHHNREPGRVLVTSVNLNGKTYKVSIAKSKVESESLVKIIFLVTLTAAAILLFITVVVNRVILQKIWHPFHVLLDQLKAFRISDKKGLRTVTTSITEFRELNEAAVALTERVIRDYKELKIFTDNASHEMMTPLAVINSKLDTFLQSNLLDSTQAQLIEEIYQAIGRLSRLNQSLMYLVKMENKLITDSVTLNLDILLEQKERQFQELIEASGLSIDLTTSPKELIINKQLADMLFNNLLSNAIRHNKYGGTIKIILTPSAFTIANTARNNIALSDKFIFERFSKGKDSEGAGLGLALCKQICDYYKYSLTYEYNGYHTFSIIFNPE